MRPIADVELSAWILGGLDPDRAAELDARVRVSPALAARTQALGRQRATWTAPPPATWTFPPVGVVLPGWPQASVSAGLLLGRPLRPGARFEVYVRDLPDAERHQVIILYAEGDAWRVLFPESPGEQLRAADLEAAPGGGRRLELSAQAKPGPQRWAVAFPPLSFSPDWGRSDPWAALAASVRAGEVRTLRFTVEVEAPR